MTVKTYKEGDKLKIRRWKPNNQQGSISLGVRVLHRNSGRKFYIIYNKSKWFISRVIDGVGYVQSRR